MKRVGEASLQGISFKKVNLHPGLGDFIYNCGSYGGWECGSRDG